MRRASFVVFLLLIGCARHAAENADIASYHAVSLDGRETSLRELRGKVVLLNVWTVWCLPCRRELPVLEHLSRVYDQAGLTLVGVNVDPRGDTRTVRRFVRSTDLTYGIWLDPDDAVSARFPRTALPASWLIGRDGRVLWSRVGVVHRHDAELGAAIRRALHGEQVARAPGDPGC